MDGREQGGERVRFEEKKICVFRVAEEGLSASATVKVTSLENRSARNEGREGTDTGRGGEREGGPNLDLLEKPEWRLDIQVACTRVDPSLTSLAPVGVFPGKVGVAYA